MNIIFSGLVSYSISIERTVPLANTLVRVYRVKRTLRPTEPMRLPAANLNVKVDLSK